MTYQRIPTPQPTPEAEIDTPEMAASAAFVEGCEEDLRMLDRAARITMELMEAQNDYAKSRLAVVARDGAPLRPGVDPTAPLNKLAQSLRRTLALKKMLAEDLEKRRAGQAARHRGEFTVISLPPPKWGGTDGEAVRVGKCDETPHSR